MEVLGLLIRSFMLIILVNHSNINNSHYDEPNLEANFYEKSPPIIIKVIVHTELCNYKVLTIMGTAGKHHGIVKILKAN